MEFRKMVTTILHEGQKRRYRLKQQTSRPMLNRCGENEHHYLVSQLKGKDFNLKPLSVCAYIYTHI